MSITVCAVWISVGRIDWMSLICKLDQSRQLDGFNSTDWKTTWRQVKPRVHNCINAVHDESLLVVVMADGRSTTVHNAVA